jgi:hypothetical protein
MTDPRAKALEAVHAKLSQKSGRKMAASDVKIMMTTIELRKWVNEQRRIAMASKGTDAEQVKRGTLGQGETDQGRVSGYLLYTGQGAAQNGWAYTPVYRV